MMGARFISLDSLEGIRNSWPWLKELNDMEQRDNLKSYFALISFLGFTLLFVGIQTAFTVKEFKYIDAISENPGLATGTLTKIIYKYPEDSAKTYEVTYKVDDELYSESTKLYWFFK